MSKPWAVALERPPRQRRDMKRSAQHGTAAQTTSCPGDRGEWGTLTQASGGSKTADFPDLTSPFNFNWLEYIHDSTVPLIIGSCSLEPVLRVPKLLISSE
jgi:hypothetical protein